MSTDPIKKSKVSVNFRDPIPKSQGRGNLDVSKNYSAGFNSLRSRIVFLSACMLPYIGICLFVYFEGLALLSIILLAIPLVFFLLFWLLQKKLNA